MKRLENWINVGSSVGVIIGIAFLAMEISQNTDMMRSQTRDSITGKQMLVSEWVTTEPEMALSISEAAMGLEAMHPERLVMYGYFMAGVWREWENSYYQYQRGLFEAAEFEPRMERWHAQMQSSAARSLWTGNREWYAPGFREVVDDIVSEIEAAAQVAQ